MKFQSRDVYTSRLFYMLDRVHCLWGFVNRFIGHTFIDLRAGQGTGVNLRGVIIFQKN